MHSLLLTVALLVAAAPSPDLARQVREQVARLDANALSERAEAEKSLIALGPAALEFLPEVTSRTPAETAQRLTRIRQALEQAQVSAAAEATRVTLIGEDLPLADVIARISQQTGNKITDYREQFGEEVTEPRISLKLEDAPFWKAVDQVLDLADLTMYDFTGQRGIFLVNRPTNVIPRQTRAAYAGPFRIEATRFESLRELRTQNGAALRLFLNVAWEPRLMPFAIRQPLDKIKAIGTGGAPIQVAGGGGGEPEASISDDSSAAELQIPLELPPRQVEEITSLKGVLRVMVPGPMQEFRFDKLPILGEGFAAQVEKIEQRKAGVTVTIDQVRKNNELWEIRTRVRFDQPGDSLESHRSWIFRNEMYLTGPNQQKVLPGGYEQTRQTDNEVGVAYLFDLPDGPKGLSFVYRTPTAVFELPVEYELRDLPLP